MAFEAAAVADRRRRRFLDGDEHVAPARPAVLELTDIDPSEQPERAEPAAALEEIAQAERRPGAAGLRGG